MTEDEKLENRNRKIKTGNALRCIMSVKRINIKDITKKTGYTTAYISRVLSGEKNMSDNLVMQLSILFDLSIDNIKDIINYYLSLDDKLDDIIKDQLTMSYLLTHILDLESIFLNQTYKDFNNKDAYKSKNQY